MIEDVNGNGKLFWKEVSNAKGGKMESCSRIKYGNGRLAQGYNEVRNICKDYFEALYNTDTHEQVSVHMCSFDGIRRGSYFEGEPKGRAQIEVRVGKLENGKAAGKDEITGETINGEGDWVVDWTWRLCNMTFKRGVVPED